MAIVVFVGGGMFTSLLTLNLTLPHLSSSSREHIWFAAPVAAVLMFASIFYSISSNRNSKKKEFKYSDDVVHASCSSSEKSESCSSNRNDTKERSDDVHVSSSSSEKSDDERILCKSTTDDCGRTLDDDGKYAEELQIQETLLASMLPDSHQTLSTSLRSLLNEEAVEECKICLEKLEHWQMFTNPTCYHSFCYACTTKHATTKMQEKNKTIPCPGINCKSTLDSNTLRLIIPQQTLVEWDEFVCESMIPISHRLYCPFANCSVLLVDDHDHGHDHDHNISITKIDCPACKRTFCAACRVPWHSDFSCKEYSKLVGKKGRKEEEITVALAKKKKWRKCPNCQFFVEKAEGCVHITCRCKYEFCYDCGAKWSGTHGGCRPR